jgi:hypothetical protein
LDGGITSLYLASRLALPGTVFFIIILWWRQVTFPSKVILIFLSYNLLQLSPLHCSPWDLCPTWERATPEGNGVSLVEGGEEGPGPQEAREIGSQCLTRAETTWTRTRRNGQVGRDEERSARTEWAVFSHRMGDHVININYVYCWVEFNTVFCFRRINHMALKPFALILCLHVAVHHVANKNIIWIRIKTMVRKSY